MPGDDLLSRGLSQSTIGAGAFHYRVRDGIGWMCSAMITRQTKKTGFGGRVSEDGIRGIARRIMRSRFSVFGTLKAASQVTRGPDVRRRKTGTDHPIPVFCILTSEERIKPIERLVPVGCIHCCTSTPGLSTWWSSTALKRDLVLRGVSRLDAFSGYPVRTWLPGYAAGATTGPPEVRPPRSSRTRGRSSQISNTHGR